MKENDEENDEESESSKESNNQDEKVENTVDEIKEFIKWANVGTTLVFAIVVYWFYEGIIDGIIELSIFLIFILMMYLTSFIGWIYLERSIPE